MIPIIKLLPLFALLASLANASIDARADNLDDMKGQTQGYDQTLNADVDQSEYQQRRSVGDQLAKDIKEDPSYCGPAGSPHCDVLQPHNAFPIHDHDHDELHARDSAGDSKFGSANRAKGWKREDAADLEAMMTDAEKGEEASDSQSGNEMHDNNPLRARDRAGNSKFGSSNRAKGWKREDGSDDLEAMTKGDGSSDRENGDGMGDDSMGDAKFGSANRAKGWKRDDDERDESMGDAKFGSANRAKGWKRDEDEGEDTGDSKFGSANRAKGWKREEKEEDMGDAKFGSANRAKGWKREEGEEDVGGTKFGSANRAKGLKREEEEEDTGDMKFGSGNQAKGW